MSDFFNLFVELEAGFAPTPEAVARKMMEVAKLRRGETFYDLGSGDGALLILAAEEFGAHAVGVELQGKFVEYSRRRVRSLGLRSLVKVVRGDFFRADISGADVLTLYLLPKALSKLRPKLERELKRGARVAVYKYPVEGWSPVETHSITDESGEAQIFLYQL